MKFLKIIAVLGCLSVASAHLNAESSDSTAQKCKACHQGALSLAGQNEDELASKIKGLSDKSNHPPVQLEDTSDEAIAGLAEALLKE